MDVKYNVKIDLFSYYIKSVLANPGGDDTYF